MLAVAGILQGFFLLLLCFIQSANGLEVLLYAFGMSRSHVMFSHRVTLTLTAQGHHVTTVLAPSPSGLKIPEFPNKDDVVIVRPELITRHMEKMEQSMMRKIVNGKSVTWQLVNLPKAMSRMMVETCSTVANDTVLMDRVRKRNYDVIITNCIDFCLFGLIEHTHKGSIICLSTGTYVADLMAIMMAIPSNPSYTPHFFTAMSDIMPFHERMGNAVAQWGMRTVMRLPVAFYRTEMDLLRRLVNSTITSIDEIAEADGLIMSGEQFIDFPRPMLHHVTYMGNLQLSGEKDLSEEWLNLLNESKNGIIMFSLGSIVKANLMEDKTKEELLTAFRRFPEFTVIWKLDDPSFLERHDLPSHVHAYDWMPQRQLLNSGKVKLFITHAGYNSLMETTLAGVPMILIPLFGDQPGNAARAVRHKLGLQLKITEITADAIEEKMRLVLNDDGFALRARAFSEMLRDKILPNEQLIMKRLEQMANGKRSFKFLKAKHLPSPVTLCLDVIVLFILISIVMTFFVYAQDKETE